MTGVDIEKFDGIGGRVDRFVEADLDHGIPDEVGGDYDTVLAADVVEHVRHPVQLLREARDRMRPGGSLDHERAELRPLVPAGPRRTRPVRLRPARDPRRGHVRFFTRASFNRTVRKAGLSVRRSEPVGPPSEIVKRGGTSDAPLGRANRMFERLSRLACQLWPTLFAYQFVYELEHRPHPPTV